MLKTLTVLCAIGLIPTVFSVKASAAISIQCNAETLARLASTDKSVQGLATVRVLEKSLTLVDLAFRLADSSQKQLLEAQKDNEKSRDAITASLMAMKMMNDELGKMQPCSDIANRILGK